MLLVVYNRCFLRVLLDLGFLYNLRIFFDKSRNLYTA